jgi:dienelactone hydrolase
MGFASPRLHNGGLCAGFLAVIAALLLASAAPSAEITERNDQFTSGGKSIRVERYQPAMAGQYPAIVLLPESAGLKYVGDIYRGVARSISREGYVVVLVNFFDRTGVDSVNPKDIKREDFLLWMDAVRDSVHFCRELPNVQGKRIGMLGFSLGAYLSLSVAREEKLQIAAVAEFFGGLPEEMWKDLKRLPPTLIVHGVKDSLVPVAEAYALRGFFQSQKLPHECKIYPNEGHMFEQEIRTFLAKMMFAALLRGDFSPVSTEQAILEAVRGSDTIQGALQTSIGFFERHLKNQP